MKCGQCGFSIPLSQAEDNRACMSCGTRMASDSDDYLLHGVGGLGKEIRMGQVAMGRLVAEVIKNKDFAIIEGPVGIGKSRAYAVPAIQSKKRIIISTAKKQLQHQLAGDLPFLAERMGETVTVALLKGKSNYACRIKGSLLPLESQAPFFAWLNTAKTGDLAEWPGRKPAYWFDVTAEDCIGKRCADSAICGYWAAKQSIKAAQIVIANHHVVAWDLRFGPKKLLGEYGVLIVDEAHQAVSAFRGAYTQTVTPFSMKRVMKMMDKTGFSSEVSELDGAWRDMLHKVKDLDGEIPGDPFGDAGVFASSLLKTMYVDIQGQLAAMGIELVQSASLETTTDDDDGTPAASSSYRASKQRREDAWSRLTRDDQELAANLEMLGKSVEKPLAALNTIRQPDLNTVIYVSSSDKGHKSVNAAPVNIGALVGPKLQAIDTVVITSATIAINGDFSDIKKQLGVTMTVRESDEEGNESIKDKRRIEELILETPFDFSRQACLYVPHHLPHAVSGSGKYVTPERTKYIEAVALECKRLIRASDGNAFILFTATTDMQDVHKALLAEDLDTPLFMQDGDAESTLREFMATPRSVLLGLKSFWEGVDVVGDKLRLVVITKLPFPRVDDPVIRARSRAIIADGVARGESQQTAERGVFQAVQIPLMLMDVRQGAGRLIRSKTDRGVLAILDPRVWTGNGKQLPIVGQRAYKGYGAQVVNAVGFSNKTADFSFVHKFLQKLVQDEAARVASQSGPAPAGA